MYICERCGEVVEEIPTGYDCHGRTSLGMELSEEVDRPCRCGGEFVEAEECKCCGEWFNPNDPYVSNPHSEVCEECFDTYNSVSDALGFGAEYTDTIDGINGFVAKALSVEQINKILTRWVEENFVDACAEVKKYLKENKSDFGDFLVENHGGYA